MKISKFGLLAISIIGISFFSNAMAKDAFYEVTVTNLTKGIVLTPVLIATTRKGDSFFQPGEAASSGLETIAETGNSSPLLGSLDYFDSVSLGFIEPGQSDSSVVATRGRYSHVTVASMLIPTNDTFFGLNSVEGPKGRKSVTYHVIAWDAGTELNDELCISLPGPGCGMDAGPVSNNGENYIYVSNGIRGVGDIDADLRDFNNPIARVTITRVK